MSIYVLTCVILHITNNQIICAKVREGDQRIVRIKEGDPGGRHVVIVDDLVQSGGTLVECQVSKSSYSAFSMMVRLTAVCIWALFSLGNRHDFGCRKGSCETYVEYNLENSDDLSYAFFFTPLVILFTTSLESLNIFFPNLFHLSFLLLYDNV